MSPDGLKHIVSQFRINGSIKSIVPYGNGHIHKTFRIFISDPGFPDYLLQNINHHVFKDVPAMMNNILKVTKYINSKGIIDFKSLNIIPALDGSPFYLDSSGLFWRIYLFNKNLTSIEVPETSDLIYEGARTFGRFAYYLFDFPVGELISAIPDFHNLLARLKILEQVAKEDQFNKRVEAKSELKNIWEAGQQLSKIQILAGKGKIPIRVTHNDTKFNNVLFDKSGKARCVVDLDTVMPGLIHYDFGDGIRTTVSESPEDESNLENIEVNRDRFRAYANGYLDGTGNSLNRIEMKYLPHSGPYMALIMAVRFLTDYFSGDMYFKTDFPGHNFQRAKAQLELCRKLFERIDDMQQIIKGRIN